MKCFLCGYDAMEPPYIFDLEELLSGLVVCRVCSAQLTTTNLPLSRRYDYTNNLIRYE